MMNASASSLYWVACHILAFSDFFLSFGNSFTTSKSKSQVYFSIRLTGIDPFKSRRPFPGPEVRNQGRRRGNDWISIMRIRGCLNLSVLMIRGGTLATAYATSLLFSGWCIVHNGWCVEKLKNKKKKVFFGGMLVCFVGQK